MGKNREFSEPKVEIFSDSWAGDKSRTERRKHSVSSGMAFLNGKLIQTWSRTRNSYCSSFVRSTWFLQVLGRKVWSLHWTALEFYHQKGNQCGNCFGPQQWQSFCSAFGSRRIQACAHQVFADGAHGAAAGLLSPLHMLYRKGWFEGGYKSVLWFAVSTTRCIYVETFSVRNLIDVPDML